MEYCSNSAEETEALGAELAVRLRPGDVVAYTGDLGAGKTAFTRGIARGLGIPESSRYDAFLQGIVQPAFDPAQSGGALMDINVYNIHALVGLFGKPAAVQYAANIARGIDTSGIALCRYPTFQAVCVGAKDCASRQTSVIEGERGVLSIEGPVSCMTGYTIDYHDGQREVHEENNPPYRMAPEFQAFARILNEQDWAYHDTLMEYSLEAAQILEDARRCAGVRFPCDSF